MTTWIEDTWVEIDADPTPPEERYVPPREPWLSAWCRLHSLHLAALAIVDATPDVELHKVRAACRAAIRLADAKYRIYLGSIGAKGGDP